jgi:hypothetical protein
MSRWMVNKEVERMRKKIWSLIWIAYEWEDWGKAKTAADRISGLGLRLESCKSPKPEVWTRPARKTISKWQECNRYCSQRLQQVKSGQCANSSWRHKLFCRPSLIRNDWCENLQWQKNVLLKLNTTSTTICSPY